MGQCCKCQRYDRNGNKTFNFDEEMQYDYSRCLSVQIYSTGGEYSLPRKVQCSNPPIPGKKCCNDHICPTCMQKEAFSNGNDLISMMQSNSGIHDNYLCVDCKCNIEYCFNPHGYGSIYCEKHTCSKCKQNEVFSGVQNANLCVDCKCHATSCSCHNEHENGSMYCNYHRCKALDIWCPNEVHGRELYCTACQKRNPAYAHEMAKIRATTPIINNHVSGGTKNVNGGGGGGFGAGLILGAILF